MYDTFLFPSFCQVQGHLPLSFLLPGPGSLFVSLGALCEGAQWSLVLPLHLRLHALTSDRCVGAP